MFQQHTLIIQDKWRLITIMLGLCLAICVLTFKYGDTTTNFEDARTFGAETTDVMYSINGHKIHCGDSRNSEECLDGARKNSHQKIALWLGNSQLQSVNQLKPNELNAPPIAFRQLIKQNIYLMTFSQPNANLQEHLLTFAYLKEQIKLKHLILPVVFDDFREDGIRSELTPFTKNSATAQQLASSKIGLKILQTSKNSEIHNESTALKGTVQSYTENKLNNWFEKNFTFWRVRPEARGQLFTDLYITRNTIFGINPSSKRKIIKSRYQDNLNALVTMLTLAKDASIQVFIYVAPLRNDVEIPYVQSEYDHFKKEIFLLAREHGVNYVNFENLVPSTFWGEKTGTKIGAQVEIDFMHFQARGHTLLANEVVKHLIQNNQK